MIRNSGRSVLSRFSSRHTAGLYADISVTGVIYYMRLLEERKLRQRIAFFDGRRALNDRSVVCSPV